MLLVVEVTFYYINMLLVQVVLGSYVWILSKILRKCTSAGFLDFIDAWIAWI